MAGERPYADSRLLGDDNALIERWRGGSTRGGEGTRRDRLGDERLRDRWLLPRVGLPNDCRGSLHPDVKQRYPEKREDQRT